jgi:hypothetical protein
MRFQLGDNLMGAKMCAGADDLVYLVCYFQDEDGRADPDRSFLVEAGRDGARLIGYFEYDLSSPAWDEGQLKLCDPFGTLHRWDGFNWSIEAKESAADWYITKLRVRRNELFALGVNMTFLSRKGQIWEKLLAPTRGISLLDMEFHKGKLYVAGTKGLFGSVNDNELSRLHIPVSSAITSVSEIGGSLILTGWKAFAGRFSDDELILFDAGERQLTIYNAVQWDQNIYFSATNDVARLDGSALKTVAHLDSKRLCTTGRFLWNLGNEGLSYSDESGTFTQVQVDFTL